MLISPGKVREWWRFGLGWLWLSRLLGTAGAVTLVPCILMFFFSASLYWLPFFFTSLAAFSAAALVKRRSVPVPAEELRRAATAARLGAAAPPPSPMFDREGRTPLERVFGEGAAGKGAG